MSESFKIIVTSEEAIEVAVVAFVVNKVDLFVVAGKDKIVVVSEFGQNVLECCQFLIS